MKIGYKIWSGGCKHARGKNARLYAIVLFLAIAGALFLGTRIASLGEPAKSASQGTQDKGRCLVFGVFGGVWGQTP